MQSTSLVLLRYLKYNEKKGWRGFVLTPRYDEEAMAQIAQMYYIDGITQSVIAKQLGLSRASVCMILSDAREYGIVVINIKHPKKYNEQLAASVMQRYPSLKQCYVIPTGITSINMLNKIVASQGTFIVKKELSSHTTVGVAWGSTIYEFMNAFDNDNNLNDIQVIPLIGGTNRVSSEFQLNEMVRKLAEKLQGTPSFIHAPAYAESIEDRELYMNSKSMQDIAEKWEKLDAAIVSIGAMPEYYKMIRCLIAKCYTIRLSLKPCLNRTAAELLEIFAAEGLTLWVSFWTMNIIEN